MIVKRDGRIPPINIVDDCLPGAIWQVIGSVDRQGYELRTQYDRRDRQTGEFIDPPGKDAKVSFTIINPFAQPRFPAVSYDERGKLIAEYLGAKNHLVVPYDKLLEKLKSGEGFAATEWPYHYSKRLLEYPTPGGGTINQLKNCVDLLAKDSLTRRAVATTRVPWIDQYLKSDQPCLGEIQFRAIEDETDPIPNKPLVLNMYLTFRSWDAPKAMGDNLVALTNIQARVAYDLQKKTRRKVFVGPLHVEGRSVHCYGQDYKDDGKVMKGFWNQFPTREAFIERSWGQDKAREQVILDLEDLLKEKDVWRFKGKQIKLIIGLIKDFSTGRFIP